MGGTWKELEIDDEKVEVENVQAETVVEDTEDEVDTSLDLDQKEDKDYETKFKELKRKERLAQQKAQQTAYVAQEILDQNKQLKDALDQEKSQKSSNEKLAYKNAAKQLETAVSALQDQLEQALATSDYKKAAELNVKIQKTVVQQQAYEAVAEEADEEEAEQRQPAKQEQSVQRPVKQTLPPQLEDWLDENPWFHRPGVNDDEADKKKTRIAIRISDELLKEGYSTQEDDFYTELSERLQKENKAKPKTTPNTQPQKGSQGGVIRRDGKLFIRPTQADVDMAKRLGLYDPQRPELFRKYMINKVKDEKAQGQYVDIEV